MILTDKSKNKPIQKYEKKTKENKVNQIQISSEEIKLHKESVTNLKNPLWHKIIY